MPDDFDRVEWVPVVNRDFYFDVPPFGVMMVCGGYGNLMTDPTGLDQFLIDPVTAKGVEPDTGCVAVSRAIRMSWFQNGASYSPDHPRLKSTCWQILVNGPESIPKGGTGRGTFNPFVRVAYDPADGTPQPGEVWGVWSLGGAQGGGGGSGGVDSDDYFGYNDRSFRLRRGGVGFRIIGDAANGVVNAFREPCAEVTGDYMTFKANVWAHDGDGYQGKVSTTEFADANSVQMFDDTAYTSGGGDPTVNVESCRVIRETITFVPKGRGHWVEAGIGGYITNKVTASGDLSGWLTGYITFVNADGTVGGGGGGNGVNGAVTDWGLFAWYEFKKLVDSINFTTHEITYRYPSFGNNRGRMVKGVYLPAMPYDRRVAWVAFAQPSSAWLGWVIGLGQGSTYIKLTPIPCDPEPPTPPVADVRCSTSPPPPPPPPPPTTWNCFSGVCTAVFDGSGSYSTYAACLAACVSTSPPPPPPPPPPTPCCGYGGGNPPYFKMVIQDGPHAGTYILNWTTSGGGAWVNGIFGVGDFLWKCAFVSGDPTDPSNYQWQLRLGGTVYNASLTDCGPPFLSTVSDSGLMSATGSTLPILVQYP